MSRQRYPDEFKIETRGDSKDSFRDRRKNILK